MITVEMVPGPVISGIAKGTTAILVLLSASSRSTLVVLVGPGLAFISAMAMSITSRPPPTWKEPTLMPRKRSKVSPTTANRQSTMATAMAVVLAIFLRSN